MVRRILSVAIELIVRLGRASSAAAAPVRVTFRRVGLLAAIAAAFVGAGLTLTSAASASPAPTLVSPPSTGDAPVRWSKLALQPMYSGFLAEEHAEHKWITPARGKQRKPSAALGTACSEPSCPLNYHGGAVQHAPAVYLLLWGPNWSTSGSDVSYLRRFFSGLGSQPLDGWSRILGQYTDSTGGPSFSGSV